MRRERLQQMPKRSTKIEQKSFLQGKNIEKEDEHKNSQNKKESLKNSAKIPNIWTSPVTTFLIFGKIVLEDIRYYFFRASRLILSFAVFCVLYYFVRTSEFWSEIGQPWEEFFLFIGYWMGLGVLSSFWMGAGMHTFALYLSPRVANFVMASWECEQQAEFHPSRFAIHPNFQCPKSWFNKDSSKLSVLALWNTIKIEAFVWGIGLALGEVPSYFLAKTARLSGQSLEETQGLKEPATESKLTKLTRELLENHSFLTLLIVSAIPNPLIDVAGISSGYFLVPFFTFLIPTILGKAFFKVHIQLLAVIFFFSKKTIESVTLFLENNISHSLANILRDVQERKRRKLTMSEDSDDGNLIAKVWDIGLLIFIGYFLLTIINSRVQTFFKKNT